MDPRQRHGEARGRRADVDSPVKHGEGIATQPGPPRTFLVVRQSHQGRDIRLDHAAAHGQQGQGKVEEEHVFDPQNHVAENVGNGKDDDRAVLAEMPVGHVPAHQRQKVDRGVEVGHYPVRRALAELQTLEHIECQDGAHAVKRGAFRQFSPKDEPEADWVVAEGGAISQFQRSGRGLGQMFSAHQTSCWGLFAGPWKIRNRPLRPRTGTLFGRLPLAEGKAKRAEP